MTEGGYAQRPEEEEEEEEMINDKVMLKRIWVLV